MKVAREDVVNGDSSDTERRNKAHKDGSRNVITKSSVSSVAPAVYDKFA